MGQLQDARADLGSVPAETQPLEVHSIGSYLAGQRGLRGISLEELAQLTRIPIRSLARLESGSYDGVTDGFVRGFVRTVAQSLGLEPDDTVARMLREPTDADDAVPPASPLIRRLLLLLGFAALLAAGAAGFAGSMVAGPAVPDPLPSELIYRRDSVGLLAQAQRAVGAPARNQSDALAIHSSPGDASERRFESPAAGAPQADVTLPRSQPID